MTLTVKEQFSCHELKTATFWRDIISEFTVSMYLNIMVDFSLFTLRKDLYTLDMTTAGFVSGFGIYLLIEGYGPISGGHMNPSVSFTHCLAGRITVIRSIFYQISICSGGIMGSEIVYLLSPPYIQKTFGPFLPHPDITPLQGMMIEFIFTLNLLFCGLMASDVRIRHVYIPGMVCGFSVAIGIWCAGTWTGACQNPMVALGPAVVSRNFTHHWIYWAGAYLAGLVAAVLHRVSYLARDRKKDLNKPDTKEHVETVMGGRTKDRHKSETKQTEEPTMAHVSYITNGKYSNGLVSNDDTRL